MKSIGLDVDGILANFYTAYEDLIVRIAGEDRFPARYPEIEPPVWNWPEHYGYSSQVVSAAWKSIKQDPVFWKSLGALPDVSTLLDIYDPMEHDYYFVTARPGVGVKTQTEDWLYMNGIHDPTVLISEEKGDVAKALKLTAYIDDKPENCLDVLVKAPQTRCYILDRAYNRELNAPGLVRVKSLGEMLEREVGVTV